MSISDPSIYFLILLTGAFIAAFVTGAVGFADGLILNAFWLHIMEPASAVALIIVSSFLIHAIPLYKLRKTLDYSRLKPFALFGVIGFPFGMWALTRINPEIFKITIGFLLLGYGLWMLIRSKSSAKMSQKPMLDGVVGLNGGFMGGFAGLAGLLPTLWVGMQNLPKNVQRGTFEPYILIVNLVGIAVFFIAGKITMQVGVDLLWALPALIIGSWLGVKVYPLINDTVFRKTVLVLILLSGLMLLV
ncbi:MAG: sulfite exporter TauE/SafE family protein [Gammaproteobacteria bacterium]